MPYYVEVCLEILTILAFSVLAVIAIRIFFENFDRIKDAITMLQHRKTVITVTDTKGTIGVTGNKCKAGHFYAVLVMYVQHGVINKEILEDMYENALKEEK